MQNISVLFAFYIKGRSYAEKTKAPSIPISYGWSQLSFNTALPRTWGIKLIIRHLLENLSHLSTSVCTKIQQGITLQHFPVFSTKTYISVVQLIFILCLDSPTITLNPSKYCLIKLSYCIQVMRLSCKRDSGCFNTIAIRERLVNGTHKPPSRKIYKWKNQKDQLSGLGSFVKTTRISLSFVC